MRKHRFLSMVLALTMLFTVLFPSVVVSADEEFLAEETVVDTPVAEAPAAEAPAAPAAEAPAAPAAEAPAPAAPAADTPAADAPAADAPAADTPAADTPAADAPAADAPAADEPAADEPAADEPAADEPAADEPAADEPAADEPAADEPAADEPAADEPAADEPAADEPAEDELTEDEEPAEEETDVIDTTKPASASPAFRRGYAEIYNTAPVFDKPVNGQKIADVSGIVKIKGRENAGLENDMLRLDVEVNGETVTGYIAASAARPLSEDEVRAYERALKAAETPAGEPAANAPADDTADDVAETPAADAPADDTADDVAETPAADAPADDAPAAAETPAADTPADDTADDAEEPAADAPADDTAADDAETPAAEEPAEDEEDDGEVIVGLIPVGGQMLLTKAPDEEPDATDEESDATVDEEPVETADETPDEEADATETDLVDEIAPPDDTLLTGTEGAVSITTQPVDAEGVIGDTVTFTVVAENVAAYQWQYSANNGVSWYNVKTASAKEATLSVDIASGNIGYLRRCKLTGVIGDVVFTDSVRITEPVGQDVVITTQPVDAEGVIGDTVTFTVVAENAASYQWQFSSNGGSTWRNVSTASGKQATNSVTIDSSNINYVRRCKVTGINGDIVFTNVVSIIEPSSDELIITTQPVDAEGVIGDTVTFTVVAENAASYQWQFSSNGGSTWRSVNTESGKQATNSVTIDKTNINYLRRCKVTGVNGDIVFTDVVGIVAPAAGDVAITTQPVDAEGVIGDTVTFTVVAENAASYQWQFSSNNGSTWKNVSTASGKLATNSVTIDATNINYLRRCKLTGVTGDIVFTDVVAIVEPAPTSITVNGVTYRILEGGETLAVESIDTTMAEALILSEVEGMTVVSIDEGVVESTSMLIYRQTGDGICTVYKYTGTASSLTVSTEVDNMTVKAIGPQAFMGNTALTSISLPNGIEVIGEQAFKGCSNLSNMTNHQ